MQKGISVRSPRDFSGGPVAKTLHSQCWGPRFNPWSGNQIQHATTKIQRSQINKYIFKRKCKIFSFLPSILTMTLKYRH